MSTDGGSQFSQLDEFVGPASGSGGLLNGSLTSLGTTMTDFSYAILDSAASVIFRVEAFSNGYNESVAFDNIRIEGIPGAGGAGGALLSIAETDAVKDEGNSGLTGFTFTITRSGDLSDVTDVTYTVSGGGADPNDFGGVFPTGLVSFQPTQTTQIVTIDVSGDLVEELDEDFTVSLSNATGGAQITNPTATGTILNDDTELSIVALEAVKDEGNSGLTGFTFTITRSGDLSDVTDVTYTVSGGGANPADPNDFGGVFPTGLVSFQPTETTQIVTIDVSGDLVEELDEDFTVSLSNATGGAQISVADAPGTILKDDGSGAPELLFQESFEGTLQYTTLGEGNAGTKDFWKVLKPTQNRLTFDLQGEDGEFVFAGRDMDEDFGGQSGAGAQRQVTFNEVDLSQHSNVALTIGLAARQGGYEASDFIRLLMSTDGGSQFSQLDEFVGPASGSGGLLNGSLTSLGTTMTDFSYAILDSAASVIFRVEAFSNGYNESVAFDNIRIEGIPGAGGASAGFIGAGGEDLFVFANNDEHDVITAFQAEVATNDLIGLNGVSSLGSFREVQQSAAAHVEATVIGLGVSDPAALLGVNAGDLVSNDFLFS